MRYTIISSLVKFVFPNHLHVFVTNSNMGNSNYRHVQYLIKLRKKERRVKYFDALSSFPKSLAKTATCICVPPMGMVKNYSKRHLD